MTEQAFPAFRSITLYDCPTCLLKWRGVDVEVVGLTEHGVFDAGTRRWCMSCDTVHQELSKTFDIAFT